MSQKKNAEDFNKEIREIYGEGYIVNWSLDGVRGKMSITHTKCNYTWETKPRNILENKNSNINICPNCLEKEKYLKSIKLNYGEGYDLDIIEFGARGKILVTHLDCKTSWEMKPRKINEIKNNNIYNILCPECRKKQFKINDDVKIEKLFEDLKIKSNILDYEFSNFYKDSSFELIHKKCNTKTKYVPRVRTDKKAIPLKCKYCDENGLEFLAKLHKEFKLVSSYKKRDKKSSDKGLLEFIHLTGECNQEPFKRREYEMLKNPTCPYCNVTIVNTGKNSAPVKRIQDILTENKIPFILERKFDTCYNPKNKSPLYFDLYISTGDVQLLIEYDGEQHYLEDCWFNKTKEDLIHRKYLDKIKTEWAKENNIPLLRIPYWEQENIETIVEEFLLKNNCI